MTEQISKADLNTTIGEARRQIADSWSWFLALGILLIIAGVAAIAFPLLSTIATKIALGWIFLIAGALIVVHAFSIRQWQGFLVSLLIGALYLVAGAWLAFTPFAGVVALTILLAALFLAEGVLEVIMAVRVRPHEGWGWLLFSGLIAIAVGVLIAAELPSSAAWAIGLLTGINLLSSGASFVALALAGRRAGRASPVPA
ncbi:MAG TPA: HdeD family acid-resistance protein [Hyphomicrobiaceae bacterium]|nr:HdeD family acid-resistance protein [Hyphomicrobiaceae bacterium]